MSNNDRECDERGLTPPEPEKRDKPAARRDFLTKTGVGAAALAHFMMLGGTEEAAAASTKSNCVFPWWPDDGDVCDPSSGNEDICAVDAEARLVMGDFCEKPEDTDECLLAIYDPATGRTKSEVGDECPDKSMYGTDDECVAPYLEEQGDECCSNPDWADDISG